MHSCATESFSVTQIHKEWETNSPSISDPNFPAPSELSFNSEKTGRHSTHYYPDGNIIVLVEDTVFKLHKAILTTHCAAFDAMFIPCREGHNVLSSEIQTITLHDELSVFTSLIDAIYSGLTFTRHLDVRHCLKVLEIASKYEARVVENYCTQYLLEELPASVMDPIDNWDKFQRYYKEPSLAKLAFRNCPRYLAPWSFYIITVKTISELGTLPSQFMGSTVPGLEAMDKNFVYQMFVLQRVNQLAVAKWNREIDGFYSTKCAKASSSRDKCARSHTVFNQRSPLFITVSEGIYDPLGLIIPRVKKHVLWKGSRHGESRNYWCYHCSNLIRGIQRDVVVYIYSCLLRSATQLGYWTGETPSCTPRSISPTNS